MYFHRCKALAVDTIPATAVLTFTRSCSPVLLYSSCTSVRVIACFVCARRSAGRMVFGDGYCTANRLTCSSRNSSPATSAAAACIANSGYSQIYYRTTTPTATSAAFASRAAPPASARSAQPRAATAALCLSAQATDLRHQALRQLATAAEASEYSRIC